MRCPLKTENSPNALKYDKTARRLGTAQTWALALLMGVFMSPTVYAASCCGGGSASTLILPKGAKHLFDVSVDIEDYSGFWNQNGDHVDDPQGTDLSQYRLNMGYATRLGDNWQASIILPYLVNDSSYSGISAQNNAFGDTTVSLWYETFDQVTCVWRVNTIEDLRPAIYIGSSILLPTGESAYGDNVTNSFDVTGRGFYRWDANLIVEKTVYPITLSTQASYGVYLERPINQEFGNAVEPYDKKAGNRRFLTASAAYTYFFDEMDSLTVSGAISDLREDQAEINHQNDPLTEMKKGSLSLSSTYETEDKSWLLKASWSHAIRADGWGQSFPTTDIFTMGFSYVLR